MAQASWWDDFAQAVWSSMALWICDDSFCGLGKAINGRPVPPVQPTWLIGLRWFEYSGVTWRWWPGAFWQSLELRVPEFHSLECDKPNMQGFIAWLVLLNTLLRATCSSLWWQGKQCFSWYGSFPCHTFVVAVLKTTAVVSISGQNRWTLAN